MPSAASNASSAAARQEIAVGGRVLGSGSALYSDPKLRAAGEFSLLGHLLGGVARGVGL